MDDKAPPASRPLKLRVRASMHRGGGDIAGASAANSALVLHPTNAAIADGSTASCPSTTFTSTCQAFVIVWPAAAVLMKFVYASSPLVIAPLSCHVATVFLEGAAVGRVHLIRLLPNSDNTCTVAIYIARRVHLAEAYNSRVKSLPTHHNRSIMLKLRSPPLCCVHAHTGP